MKKLSKILTIFISLILLSANSFAILNETNNTNQIQNENNKIISNYKTVKAEFDKNKEAYTNGKKEWNSIKGEFRKSIANGKMPNEEIILKGKKFLDLTINKMVSNLNLISEKIKESKSENKEEAIKNIDKQIDYLENSLRNQIQNAKTKEDFLLIAKDVKSAWNENKNIIKTEIGIFAYYKSNSIIFKLEKAINKTEERLQIAKQNGKDVEKFEIKLNQIKEKISLAKSELELGKTKFIEARNSQEIDALLIVAKQKMIKSKSYLKESYLEIKSLIGGRKWLKKIYY